MISASIGWLALTLNFLVTIKADGNVTTPGCTAQHLNDIFGTNKYILYGLTADCQLFFATSIPDGEDLGKQFGPQPVANHFPRNLNCKSARMFPMRNVNNQLKLLLIYVAETQ